MPFHEELKPLLPSLQPLWTHNDLHASNLFWSDTSSARTCHRCHRLRTRRPHQRRLRHRPGHRTQHRGVARPRCTTPKTAKMSLCTWITYGRCSTATSEYGLSATQKPRHWPRWLALGHAEFALTEADYFLGVLQSPEKARVATHDYLVGHAQWFRGPGWTKAPRRHCAAGPKHANARRCAHDPLGNHPLSHRQLGRTRRLCDDGCRHLAHHQAAAHLLAGRSRRRYLLSDRFLSSPASFRRTATGILHCLHALRLVALVAGRARRRRGARSSACATEPAHRAGCGRCGQLRARRTGQATSRRAALS